MWCVTLRGLISSEGRVEMRRRRVHYVMLLKFMSVRISSIDDHSVLKSEKSDP
jgi:hypothetical protein